jgi:hypothetical protein
MDRIGYFRTDFSKCLVVGPWCTRGCSKVGEALHEVIGTVANAAKRLNNEWYKCRSDCGGVRVVDTAFAILFICSEAQGN